MPVALPLTAPARPRLLRPPPVWMILCFAFAVLSLGVGLRHPVVPDEIIALEPVSGL